MIRGVQPVSAARHVPRPHARSATMPRGTGFEISSTRFACVAKATRHPVQSKSITNRNVTTADAPSFPGKSFKLNFAHVFFNEGVSAT
eukprot:3846545-Rhodomonas_salina.1